MGGGGRGVRRGGLCGRQAVVVIVGRGRRWQEMEGGMVVNVKCRAVQHDGGGGGSSPGIKKGGEAWGERFTRPVGAGRGGMA